MQIFLVRVSLGDAYAVVDLADGRLLSSAEASKLCEACQVIEESPNLQRVAERIVLTWTFELASGKPIDSRWQALIAEWCHRRLGSTERGRPEDSPIKKLAVGWGLVELAEKYRKVYGVKKQIYAELETRFGLKRSQLSKLINGFDPWEFMKNKASGKSD